MVETATSGGRRPRRLDRLDPEGGVSLGAGAEPRAMDGNGQRRRRRGRPRPDLSIREADLPIVTATLVAAKVDGEELPWDLAPRHRAYSSSTDLDLVALGTGPAGEEDGGGGTGARDGVGAKRGRERDFFLPY